MLIKRTNRPQGEHLNNNLIGLYRIDGLRLSVELKMYISSYLGLVKKGSEILNLIFPT